MDRCETQDKGLARGGMRSSGLDPELQRCEGCTDETVQHIVSAEA